MMALSGILDACQAVRYEQLLGSLQGHAEPCMQLNAGLICMSSIAMSVHRQKSSLTMDTDSSPWGYGPLANACTVPEDGICNSLPAG